MSTKLPKVAIIGIGPAGLAAAHAVRMWDGKFALASKGPYQSALYGCQYLHRPLPLISPPEPETQVQYVLNGTKAGYRRKVYGAGYNGPVSVETFTGRHDAWDLRRAYSRLWKRYIVEAGGEDGPMPIVISPERLAGMSDVLRETYDMVISTVPAPNLCTKPDQHSFNSQRIFAIGDAPELSVSIPIELPDDNVICNGDPDVSWYRASRIFGHGTVEWSGEKKPPYEGVKAVDKPLWTDCDCFPWLHRLGRYGSWRKSVLVHDVFEQAELLMKIWHGHSLLTKRKDWCHRCGFTAMSERPVIQPAGGIEYRCLNGHKWSNYAERV